MKVCTVSQSFFPHAGGVSYYQLWLGHKLQQSGHELTVVHLRPPEAAAEDTVEGIKVHRVPSGTPEPRTLAGYTKFKELILKVYHGVEVSDDKILNKHLYGFNEYMQVNKWFTRKIREIADKEQFDILHVHDFQVLPLASMLRDLPVAKIFTWHIPFTERASKLWRRFTVEHMQQYDRVVLSTRVYIAAAIRSGLSWDRAVCIHPFIAVTKRSGLEFREKYAIKPDEKMILCVARIDPLKGQDRLVKAMPAVLQEISDVKCVFVGNGSMTKEVLKAQAKKEFDAQLRSLVADLDLEEKVVFTGHVPREVIMQAYDACDIVVLPSIMEGFGLAVTEGMAFGKPVVGTATGGIMTQIWPGTNGFLVEPGNVDQLSQALVRLLSDVELQKRMGAKALEVYRKNYSLERGVRDHMELYEDVLQSRKPPPSRRAHRRNTKELPD